MNMLVLICLKYLSVRSSSDFRPFYAHLGELRAFAPPGSPMLAATATVTEVMRKEIVEVLEMTGCAVISVSPNKPNIFYSVKVRFSENLAFITSDLLWNNIKANRVIVYCQLIVTRTTNSCLLFLCCMAAVEQHTDSAMNRF